MDYDRFEGPDGVEVRFPRDQDYRTCSICGGDCEPEDAGADGMGVRIAFVCPEHGVHAIIDPFADRR